MRRVERSARRPDRIVELGARLGLQLGDFFLVFFRRRIAVVDQIAAALQVGIALELIGVERCFVEYLGRIEQVGAQVDEVQAP